MAGGALLKRPVTAEWRNVAVSSDVVAAAHGTSSSRRTGSGVTCRVCGKRCLIVRGLSNFSRLQ